MRTIRNRLKTAGYRATRPVKRPLLTPAHKAPFWYGVWYATGGILHCGERFIGSMKATFFCRWLKEELVFEGNLMSPTLPSTSRKPFHLAVVLWWYEDAFCVIARWIWSLFKSILIGHGIRGTSWKPLSFTLTTMFWPQDQCLRTVMLEHVQWWSSFSKMQPLPFCGRHKVPTSIYLRPCETFWVDKYLWDILQSKI